MPPGYSLTASRSAFAGLNEAAVEAAMAMLSPVRGLRPVRAGRDRVEKAPKPVIVTVSSRASASAMPENTASAASASDSDSEVLAATRAVSSRLFTLVSFRRSARPKRIKVPIVVRFDIDQGFTRESEGSVEPDGRNVRLRADIVRVAEDAIAPRVRVATMSGSIPRKRRALPSGRGSRALWVAEEPSSGVAAPDTVDIRVVVVLVGNTI